MLKSVFPTAAILCTRHPESTRKANYYKHYFLQIIDVNRKEDENFNCIFADENMGVVSTGWKMLLWFRELHYLGLFVEADFLKKTTMETGFSVKNM